MSLRNGMLASLGMALEAETIAFKARVLADGGEIVSLQYANEEIKRLKSVGMWSNVFAYPSPEFAIKRNASDSTKVEKIYCLKRALMDLIQTNSNYQGILQTAPNGRGSVYLDGVNDYYQSGIDTAMVQPLTNWFNCYKSASEVSLGYYYDGQNTFDNCRVYGGFTAYAGTSLAPPAITITNTVRQRVIFNGAASSNTVYASTRTGAIGARPMEGITIGKPGGSFATASGYNQRFNFHSLLVLAGVATAGEISSTDSVYSSRYI